MKCRTSNIILIGMMGAGKTTIGQRLARRLNYSFLDTDQIVVEETGWSVTELFCREGEAGFRRREAEIIQRIAGNKRCIIATGGGAVLLPENIAHLKEHGWIIYLDAGLRTLAERLKGEQNRPLLRDADPEKRLRELLQKRLTLYRKAADWEISTDTLTLDEVVDQIVQKINTV